MTFCFYNVSTFLENDGKINVKLSQFSDSKAKGNAVFWNPFEALKTVSNKGNEITLSAATILEHEVAHVVKNITNPEQVKIDNQEGNDKQFDTKEEGRVITGAEMKTGNLSSRNTIKINRKIMQIAKEFKNNELVYDNVKKGAITQTVDINNEIININFNDIIDTQFTGGNVGQKFEQLKGDLNLGMYSKAPCGGFVNFFKVIGSKGNEYTIYSGINEVSNSHYIVTIHKILKG